MTVATSSLTTRIPDGSTLATYTQFVKDYANGVIALLSAAGATRTTTPTTAEQFEPGNFGPGALPAGSNTWLLADINGKNSLYYRLNDADQATAPAYLRIQFWAIAGVATGYGIVAHFTFGHDANATGLVGPTAAGATPSYTSSSFSGMTTPARPCWAVTQPGYLAIALADDLNAGYGQAFAVMDRLRNPDGSLSTPAGTVFVMGYHQGSSPPSTSANKTIGHSIPSLARLYSNAGGPGVAVMSDTVTTGLSSDDKMYVGPALITTPTIKTCQNILGVYNNDFPSGTVFQAPSPGLASGTFRSSKIHGNMMLNSVATSAMIACRYE